MKKLVRETVGLFAKAAFIALLLTLYLIAGVVLAVPYAFAAGGANADALVGLAFFAPAAAFCLLVCWCLHRVGRNEKDWLYFSWVVFWGALLYVNLPILLNGSSLLLDYVGYGTSAHYVFLLRYWSLFLVPALALLAHCVWAAIMELMDKIKGRKSQSPLEVG